MLCSQIRNQVETVQSGWDIQQASEAKDYIDQVDLDPRDYIRVPLKLNASMRDGTVSSDDLEISVSPESVNPESPRDVEPDQSMDICSLIDILNDEVEPILYEL